MPSRLVGRGEHKITESNRAASNQTNGSIFAYAAFKSKVNNRVSYLRLSELQLRQTPPTPESKLQAHSCQCQNHQTIPT